MRLVQRFGRIDRIGSRNEQIQLINFWPDMQLDDYINLKARVAVSYTHLDVYKRQILNFAPEDYPPIQCRLDRMKDLAKQYENTLDRGVWWELNNQLMELRSQLMRYRVFQILLKEDDRFLNETQQYTESYSFFTDEEMDEQECSKDRWLEMYRQKEEEGRTPPFLLIVDGGREDKWRYYKLQMARYRRYIDDRCV